MSLDVWSLCKMLRVRISPLPLDWTYTGSTDAWSTNTALDNAGTGLIPMCPMIIIYSMCGCFCTTSTNKIHYYYYGNAYMCCVSM